MKMDSMSAKDKFEVNRQASFFQELVHNLNWDWQMTSAISTDTSKPSSGPSGAQSFHSELKWDSLPSAVLDACLRAFSALTSVTSASSWVRIPYLQIGAGSGRRPDFSIVITLEGDQLMAQATHQPKFPLFAESETKFFLKVVDAQIEFARDQNGAVSSLTLHQGGRDMKGARK